MNAAVAEVQGSNQPLVQIRNLSKVYERGKQKLEVLHHIDLDIARGDFFALMGPSGSGKTTLLNLIGGLDSPSDGSLAVDGKRIDKMAEGQLARWRAGNVGFVFQFYNLMPALTAQKNVELPLLLTKLSKAERRKNVETALDLVGLSDRMHHQPKQLSGGQEQRVAIARAIVTDPDLILADEPTGNLHSAQGKEIMDMFKRLNDDGTTIVQVTHSETNAAYGNRIVRLEDGWIVNGQ